MSASKKRKSRTSTQTVGQETQDNENNAIEHAREASGAVTSGGTAGSSLKDLQNSAGGEQSVEISLKPSHEIPAFLTKLYNMVNDKNSNDLIKWSDDGLSFIVLQQEEFAHQVLPKFFKHNNFSSFVRQLNMYGFHKVQHVLSGSLTTSNDPETWEFTNENFRREQPELLANVKRKSTRAVIGKPQLQNISDIHEVLGDMASIKQAQATIAQELLQLRQQNQLLWQETFEQRRKHEQQQQMITKILGFLASVVSGKQGAHAIQSSKKRRLLMDRSSSDDEPSPNIDQPSDLQDKIVELLNTPTDQTPSLPIIPAATNNLSNNNSNNNNLISYSPDFLNSLPDGSENHADRLSEDINLLQDNLENIQDYLGISDNDLQNFNEGDVDALLKDFY